MVRGGCDRGERRKGVVREGCGERGGKVWGERRKGVVSGGCA